MGYPSDFFQLEKINEHSYDLDSNGAQINFEKLFQGLPFWQHPNSEVEVKKTLILISWEIADWPLETIETFKLKLINLIKDDFTLYLWQKNEDFIPLTKKNITCLNDLPVRKKLICADTQVVFQSALDTLKLNEDEILILNDDGIDQIINDYPGNKDRPLKLSDYANSTHAHDELLPVLKNAKPSFTTILQDAFCKKSNLACQELRRHFPTIPFITQYTSLTLDGQDVIHLLNNKSLTLHHETITIQDLENITNLHLKNKINAKQLESALNLTKNLKNLKIMFGEIILPIHHLQNLSELETISITCGNLSTDNLIQLAQSSPKLQSFSLIQANLKGSLTQPLHFTQLKTLDLYQCQFTASEIENIFSHTPRLESLHLSEITIQGTISSPLHLPSLTSIYIKGWFSTDNLQKCIENTNNLVSLELKETQLTGTFSQALNLPHLANAKLSNLKTITAENFEKLFCNATQIKTLTIYDCKIEGNISNINFVALQNLQLVHIKISAISFHAILQHAQTVKVIIFSKSALHGEIPTPLPLQSLQTLKLHHKKSSSAESDQFSLSNLENLIIHASQLEHLSIKRVTLNNTDTKLSINLISLKRLELQKCDLTGNHFGSLIKHATSLNELITNGTTVTGDVLESASKSLKEADFNTCQMTAASFENILAKATSIESLNLRFSEFEGPLTRLPYFNALKFLDLEHSNLTLSSKMYVLSKTPKITKLNILQEHITAENLYELFNYIPCIEELNLQQTKIQNDLTKPINLPNLRKLNLTRSKISPESLSLFIAKSNHLDTLNLTKTNISNFTYNSLTFSSVRDLNLSHSTLNPLINLIHAPNVETLNIKYLKTCQIENLEIFLNTATKIRRLAIEAPLFKDEFGSNITHFPLPHLQYLRIKSHSEISSFLYQLTQNAASLKQLYITNACILENLNAHLMLPALQHLSLEEVHLTFKNLIFLLELTPHLKTLIIEESTIDNLDLTTLKQIALARSIDLQISSPKEASHAEATPLAEEDKPNESVLLLTCKHNPSAFLNLQLPSNDFKFDYKGNYKTKNQNMVMDQLSQYLTLINKDINAIPIIQRGICAALSDLFFNKSLGEWDTMINTVQQWNGTLETISDELRDYFELLLKQVKLFYINNEDASNNTPTYYIGNDDLLSGYLISHDKILLSNPWHTITIKRLSSPHQWLFYDPNEPNGHLGFSALNHLLGKIHHNLGQLILTEKNDDIPLEINDVNQFIADGGLLVLRNCLHLPQFQPMLTKLQNKKFSHQALAQGLCLRTVLGEPIWKKALSTSSDALKSFVNDLIKQFAALEPNYHHFLANSISTPPPFEKQENKADAKAPSSPKEPISKEIETVYHAVRQKSKIAYYEKLFETWKDRIPTESTPLEYCQDITHHNTPARRRLIKFSSSKDLDNFSLLLQQYCQSINQPVFYAHSPEHLICASPYIERINAERGEFKKGPGGPAHRFLTTPQEETRPSVIIFNGRNFKPDDLVRLNTLIDSPDRFVDDTPVSPSAIVVGLTDTQHSNFYNEADFIGRFDVIDSYPYAPTAIHLQPDIPKREAHDETLYYTIDFYHGDDWLRQLVGHWVLKKDNWYFKPGQLEAALQSGKAIEIKNGLWNNAFFRYFWSQAILLGHIKNPHALDANNIWDISSIQWVQSEGYDWIILKNHVTFTLDHQHSAPTLNPGQFSKFFVQYQCDNEYETLDTLEGFLEEHKNQTLHINVTRTLSDDHWGRLLHACEVHHVRLHAHCAPGIHLPAALKGDFDTGMTRITAWQPSTDQVTVTYSDDVSTTTALLTMHDKPWQVIDISEYSAGNLLTHITGNLDSRALRLKFKEITGALDHFQGQNVILRGKFSPELADALAPFLFGSCHHEGLLRLVCENKAVFDYAPSIQQHHVSDAEQHYVLKNLLHFTETELTTVPKIEGESLDHWQARLVDYRIYGNADPKRPWRGLKTLTRGSKLEPFNPTQSANMITEQTQAFLKKRKDEINAVLNHAQFTVITGLSGAGKSTFMTDHFADENTTVYLGLDNKERWEKDPKPLSHRKVLVIDEANIGDRQWSEFESSYANYVVFLCNPISYGSNRKIPSLFARHGNAVVFDILPMNVVYELTLKPILVPSALALQALVIAQKILDVYHFLCECSEDRVLISPRELQMMALFTLSYCEKNKASDPIHVAQHYAYQLGKELVPADQRIAFKTQFKPATPLAITINASLNGYVVTSSRKSLYQRVNELLDLRAYRRAHADTLNHSQLYGGLGGIIVSGKPGVGKTKLVDKILKQLPEDEICRIRASVDNEIKKSLLVNSCLKGKVMVFDEINSAPLMENILNDVTMGKLPDNTKPSKIVDDNQIPGSILFGTQNKNLRGRYKMSEALARRLLQTTLTEYTQSELMSIFTIRGIDPQELQIVIEAYLKKCKEALDNHFKPEPTFRHLEKIVNKLLCEGLLTLVIQPTPSIYSNDPANNNYLFWKQGNALPLNPPPRPASTPGYNLE